MLPFTYTAPTVKSPPLYDGTQKPWEPVSIRFQPEIWDHVGMVRHNVAMVSKPSFPGSANVREIWVESRRAYEILNNMPRPSNRQPLVRIAMPVIPKFPPQRQIYDLVCCVERPADMEIATKILNKISGVIAQGAHHWPLMRQAKIVAFPLDRASSLYWLSYAVASDIKIASSDAGAAEEYLCKGAPPGSWHVIHSQQPDHYIEAVKDLLGESSKWLQTNYLDEAPYVRPYK